MEVKVRVLRASHPLGAPGPAPHERPGTVGKNTQKPGVWTASPSVSFSSAPYSGEDTVPSQTPA